MNHIKVFPDGSVKIPQPLYYNEREMKAAIAWLEQYMTQQLPPLRSWYAERMLPQNIIIRNHRNGSKTVSAPLNYWHRAVEWKDLKDIFEINP